MGYRCLALPSRSSFQKIPPSHRHFSIKNHHEIPNWIPWNYHETIMKSHEIIMKPSWNPMKPSWNPMKLSWNHHETMMKSHEIIMKSSWNHPFSSIFMPWGAWLGLRHGQGLVSLRCFWAARRFGIRCQLGTANGKHGASDEIPGPLGPLQSPWVPLGPEENPDWPWIFWYFLLGFSKNQGFSFRSDRSCNDLGFGRWVSTQGQC